MNHPRTGVIHHAPAVLPDSVCVDTSNSNECRAKQHDVHPIRSRGRPCAWKKDARGKQCPGPGRGKRSATQVKSWQGSQCHNEQIKKFKDTTTEKQRVRMHVPGRCFWCCLISVLMFMGIWLFFGMYGKQWG